MPFVLHSPASLSHTTRAPDYRGCTAQARRPLSPSVTQQCGQQARRGLRCRALSCAPARRGHGQHEPVRRRPRRCACWRARCGPGGACGACGACGGFSARTDGQHQPLHTRPSGARGRGCVPWGLLPHPPGALPPRASCGRSVGLGGRGRGRRGCALWNRRGCALCGAPRAAPPGAPVCAPRPPSAPRACGWCGR